MENFNLYVDGLDYSQIKKLFEDKGTVQTFKRKEYFVKQNTPSLCAGWIERGDFRYTCIGDDGKEHIVGYSFTGEFVCDYSSFMKQDLALVNIQTPIWPAQKFVVITISSSLARKQEKGSNLGS